MERLSIWKMIVLGFQHVCVMYGGAVVVPIVVASALGLTQQQLVYLISYDLLGCGIATIIQTIGGKGFGIRLPALLAVSFIVVQPVIAIGKIYSMTGVLGAVIVSGIVVTILSQFVGKVIKYFPPIVTGSVVLIIGVHIMPVAMENAAGGSGSENFGDLKNLMLAVFTLVLFFFLNYYFKGFIKTVAILISMAVGTIVAAFGGMVDFSKIGKADWITPIQPFYFGMPTFHLSAIVTMSIVGMIIMIESTGVFMALGQLTNRELKDHDITKGLRAEGIATAISGILNGFNHSTFSQNVGLVYITKVTSRVVVAIGGIILIVLGLVPKIAAVTTMIPAPVLGGAMIPMFGMLISAALRMIGEADFSKSSNQLVVAIGVGTGLAVGGVPSAFEAFPDTLKLIFANGVVMGTFALFLSNLILNGKSKITPVIDHTEPVDTKKLS
ncbi:NCS2 family nucleobase:cation symporter-2/xanthine permease [Scopulibacillus darangshiensis]|uniref:NCS2 family nucleobase:cation symporter-2/xanthine permease n=1 Tax=Scopulibacillus darangshiensis TaxID=442528 RepID=A0A4R2NJW6_9BACL|nr:nucleobase:cation symporter-2 family protein [Scopulibacillus darangshiensis]TCP21652.1 NCS2 family nucleobase:cation symporter-2/xanthine permease [Scopulibacillus darangshiensis]